MKITGIQGLDPRKRIASLFLTPLCDMGCRFCASESDFSVMSFDEATSLLSALRGRVDGVVLGGGEPFLWPHDLAKLACLACDMGLRVQVCTNGVSMPTGFDRIEAIHRYILPLEAMDPALHDTLRIRPGGGHHGIVMDRIEVLAKAGREITLSTVVTSKNISELQAIAEWLTWQSLVGLKVHAWHLYRFLPVGRGGVPHGQELTVDREAYLQACDAMKSAGLPFQVMRRDDMTRASTVEFCWFENGRLRLGSEAFRNPVRV